MPKMIQIRNVPEKLHRLLKTRAAEEGMSLSDYLLRILRDSASSPSWSEFRRLYEKLTPIEPDIEAAELIRQQRDS